MNKIIIATILVFGAIAYAELPTTIKEAETREALEYLDNKAISVQKATVGFSDNKSTSTVSGWLDIGLNIVTNATTSSTVCSATCASGFKVLGGGCSNTSTTIQNSYPNGPSYWTCNLAAVAATCTAYAICARIK